ncbi:hypothetical protein X735_24225 [Mesorhizobium sp. L2C085B000]|nr:hypothetical protein X735_24225 [Mesorhizobium sp. L2C085B000]
MPQVFELAPAESQRQKFERTGGPARSTPEKYAQQSLAMSAISSRRVGELVGMASKQRG